MVERAVATLDCLVDDLVAGGITDCDGMLGALSTQGGDWCIFLLASALLHGTYTADYAIANIGDVSRLVDAKV